MDCYEEAGKGDGDRSPRGVRQIYHCPGVAMPAAILVKADTLTKAEAEILPPDGSIHQYTGGLYENRHGSLLVP